MTKGLDETALKDKTSFPLLSRLSVMMFLQYFVQGAYLPVAAVYVKESLGFSDREVGVFVSALAVGPILAPFIVGQLVDRFFATERVVSFCHLVGGILMLILSTEVRPLPVIVIGTIYSILYVPTMMLTNSLAFQQLKNSDMEFPWIRAFGTFGFIVPAYLIEFWWLYGLEGAALDKARAGKQDADDHPAPAQQQIRRVKAPPVHNLDKQQRCDPGRDCDGRHSEVAANGR